MSAQKALQGSKAETRELQGVTVLSKYFPRRGVVIDRPDDLMNYIKRKQKKIELVARPVVR